MTEDTLQKQQQPKYLADAILVAAGTLMMESPLPFTKENKDDYNDDEDNNEDKSSLPLSNHTTRTTVLDDLALEKKKKEHSNKRLTKKPPLRRAKSQLDVSSSPPPSTTVLDDLDLDKEKDERGIKRLKKNPPLRRAKSELDVSSSPPPSTSLPLSKQIAGTAVLDELALEKKKKEHNNKKLKKRHPMSKSSHGKQHCHSDGDAWRRENSNGNHHHRHSDGTTSRWERTTSGGPKSSRSPCNHRDEKKEEAGKGMKKSSRHSAAVDESSMHHNKKISGAKGTKHHRTRSRSPRRDGHHHPETEMKKRTTSKSPSRISGTISKSPSRNHRNSDRKKRISDPADMEVNSSGRHRRHHGERNATRRSKSHDHGASPGRRVSPTESCRRNDINSGISGGSRHRGMEGGRSLIRSRSDERHEGSPGRQLSRTGVGDSSLRKDINDNSTGGGRHRRSDGGRSPRKHKAHGRGGSPGQREGSPTTGNGRPTKTAQRNTRARERMSRSLSRSRVQDDTSGHEGNPTGITSSKSAHSSTRARERMSRSLSRSRVQDDTSGQASQAEDTKEITSASTEFNRDFQPNEQSTPDDDDPFGTAFTADVDAWAVQGYTNKPTDNHTSQASTVGGGLLKTIVSTTGRLGINVASTTAHVGLNVASTTAHVGLNVASTTANVASTSAWTGLKAFTTFSTAATKTASSALSQANTAIFHGDTAHQMMIEGLAPGQNLAKFVEEMQSGAIDNVNKSWKCLKKIPNYDQKTGILLFTHLFEHCPPAKGVFGFPSDIDPSSKEVQDNPSFMAKSGYLIVMLDKALALLAGVGPDTSELQKILFDLGKRHGRMGVEQQYFAFMGSALVHALKELLKENDFTPAIEKSWVLVYNVLAAEMCIGMNTDSIVIESWSKIKKIPYYKERVGSILFLHLFRQCPESADLFGISQDYLKDAETLKTSVKFRMHSEYFILMFEKALHMFEEKKFEENMTELGEKHFRFGVTIEQFPIMGEGLLRAVEVMLKNDFNDEMRDAWLTAYGRMSSKIISVMRSFQN